MNTKKCEWVKRELLAYRDRAEAENKLEWPWLSELNGRPASKKAANKFMLGAIINYQIKANTAWENARRFAKDDLGDPRDLWEAIAGIGKRRWFSESTRRKYSLHRYPAGHERVWHIGADICEYYGGDARKIWMRQQPADILWRLDKLGKRGVGPEISRMIVGALIDTKQIKGKGELKADIHVRRVLGRVFDGEDKVSAGRAHEVANKLMPGNSWRLDGCLYLLGKKICKSSPFCEECPLERKCIFAKM